MSHVATSSSVEEHFVTERWESVSDFLDEL